MPTSDPDAAADGRGSVGGGLPSSVGAVFGSPLAKPASQSGPFAGKGHTLGEATCTQIVYLVSLPIPAGWPRYNLDKRPQPSVQSYWLRVLCTCFCDECSDKGLAPELLMSNAFREQWRQRR